MTDKNKIKKDELWVRGYEGLYSVCKNGGVRTHQGRVNGLSHLKQSIHPSGYLVVTLSKEKKQKVFKVHVLIANAFLIKEEHHQCINHIDGDKTNNCLSNLERCTFSHNRQHAVDNNLHKAPEGENHYKSKLTLKDVKEIKDMISYGHPTKTIANQFNVTNENIKAIKQNRSWKNV